MNHIKVLEKRIEILEKKLHKCHSRLDQIEEVQSTKKFRKFLYENGIKTKTDFPLLEYAAHEVKMKENDREKLDKLIRPYIDKPIPSRTVANRLNQQINKIFEKYGSEFKNVLRL